MRVARFLTDSIRLQKAFGDRYAGLGAEAPINEVIIAFVEHEEMRSP